jgi:hypothetical protein
MTKQSSTQKKASPWIMILVIIIIAGVISTNLLLMSCTEDKETGEELKILEYTDKEYGYSFQYPSDWKLQEAPSGYEIGQARVLLVEPSGNSVVALIGDVGKSISKDEFIGDSNNVEIAGQMMDLAVKQIYQPTAKDLGATEILVADKVILPSEVSIQFYISTFNFVDSTTQITLVGIHAVPFGKDHMISFLGTTVLNSATEAENETISLILSSFHLLDEKPPE